MNEILISENQYLRWERLEDNQALLIEQIQPAGPFFTCIGVIGPAIGLNPLNELS